MTTETLVPNFTKFFSNKDVQAFETADITNPNWFIEAHQADDEDSFTTITLGEAVEAIKRTEALSQQKELDTKKVINIARSLFINGDPLYQLPLFYAIGAEGTRYVGGARHRVEAIVQFMKEFGHESANIQALIDQTKLVVIERYLENTDELITRVISDNDSRTVRGDEKADLMVQSKFGIKAGEAKASDINMVMASDEPHSVKKMTLAREYSVLAKKGKFNLKPTTQYNIGLKLAGYVLETAKANDVPVTGKAFLTVAKELVKAVPEIVGELEITNVAREVETIFIHFVTKVLPTISIDPPKARKAKSADEDNTEA